MPNGDPERPDLDELDWRPDRRADSLTRVFRHAVGLAREAEGWYTQRRRWKRYAGRLLRAAAILLGTVAAIIPILAEIYTDGDEPGIAPGWAAVALAGAAALVAFDRFFGFSGAWMRFIAAELQIVRLRHAFEYQWQEAWATAPDPPDDAHVTRLLALARDFVLAVDGVVVEETGAWVNEFRTTLERAEQGFGSGRS